MSGGPVGCEVPGRENPRVQPPLCSLYQNLRVHTKVDGPRIFEWGH